MPIINVSFTDGEPDFILPENSSFHNADVRQYENEESLKAEFSDWIIISSSPKTVATQKEASIPVRHFVQKLLGTEVYGALKIARLGLQSKFQNNAASMQDIKILGALESAADLMQMGDMIDLRDPMVSTMLDIAIGIPAVPFDTDDKARVLSNTVI